MALQGSVLSIVLRQISSAKKYQWSIAKVLLAHAASGDGSHPGEAANFVRSMRTKLDRGGTACIIVIQNLMRIVLKNNKQCNDTKYFKVIKSRNYF